MAITDDDRYRLHRRLEVVMGDDEAAILMGHLPPTGWADVATTTDLDHLRVLVKADVDQLRMETRAEFADVRREMADLRTDVYDRIAAVDKSVIRETSAIRVELHKTLRAHTLFLVATNLSAVGLLTYFFRG